MLKSHRNKEIKHVKYFLLQIYYLNTFFLLFCFVLSDIKVSYSRLWELTTRVVYFTA